MIGRVPPKVAARIDLMRERDPVALDRLETLRAQFLDPDTLDQKTVQLIAFAILLVQTSNAAGNHARAALRAGATPKELIDTVHIAFLFRGLAAANHAGEILADVFAATEQADP
ncbi:carboxymuconolactone decarboxylase family protein [Rhodovulum iodosum]|nr:carboxymuconolactone decarboxylase family protein [Rhodovulum robiginosum]